MDIERLLQLTIDHGASDLNLSGGDPPLLRVDGALRALELAPLAGAQIARLLHGVLHEPQRSAYAGELEIGIAIVPASGTPFRLRVQQPGRRGRGLAPAASGAIVEGLVRSCRTAQAVGGARG